MSSEARTRPPLSLQPRAHCRHRAVKATYAVRASWGKEGVVRCPGQLGLIPWDSSKVCFPASLPSCSESGDFPLETCSWWQWHPSFRFQPKAEAKKRPSTVRAQCPKTLSSATMRRTTVQTPHAFCCPYLRMNPRQVAHVSLFIFAFFPCPRSSPRGSRAPTQKGPCVEDTEAIDLANTRRWLIQCLEAVLQNHSEQSYLKMHKPISLRRFHEVF